MLRRARVLVVVTAFVAVAAACSSGKDFGAATTTTTAAPPATTTTTATAGPAASGAPASPDALAALLIDRVPSGFTVQPDDVGDTGPSDLAKAVRDDGSPGAEAALRGEGFVRGYQRLWENPDQSQIIVFVYQFATRAGARRDFTRAVVQNRDFRTGTTPFTVPGIPTTDHLAVEGTKDNAAAVVGFTTGVFNVLVVCNGATLAGLRARVVALAVEQYRRLPKA